MDRYLDAVRRRDAAEAERIDLTPTIFDLITDNPLGLDAPRVEYAGRIWQPRSNMEWAYDAEEAELRKQRDALTKELTKLRKQQQQDGTATWTGAVKQYIIPERTEN